MNEKMGLWIGIIGYALPILILSGFYFGQFNLMPPGYVLAIDGFVVSKNLVLIALLYFISKLGLFLATYFQKVNYSR